MNIRKTITSEIEWNTIKKAQADGKLQELLQVGDELDITLKTGEELTVQAVGTTEHGLIFLLKDCMKDEHGMNKRMTSKGGWRDSEMRLWLNETIIHMLPDELREIIVPRRIVQIMDGERLESEDKLWLPSFTEMFGKEGAEDWAPADTDETQLELFSTERSRVKERPGNGTWWYWLRSPYGSYSTRFCLSTAATAAPTTPARAMRMAWPSASAFNLRSKPSARRVRGKETKHETELQQLRTCLPGGMEPRHRRAALRIQRQGRRNAHRRGRTAFP